MSEQIPWTIETMRLINEMTPSIIGKAFDPDWFLLRQRFEQIEAQVAQLQTTISQLEAQMEHEAKVNVPAYVALSDKIIQQQATISQAREFLEAIVIAFKEPDGGPCFKLRALAEKQGIYADDLGRDRVMLRIAQAALANITQEPEVEHEPQA